MSHPLPLRSSRSAPRRGRLACLTLALGLLLAASAHARTETLRWGHESPGEVAGFRIHVGLSPGSYLLDVEAGKPGVGGGEFEYVLDLAGLALGPVADLDLATVYVAVSAYGTDGRQSPLSNERARHGSGSSDDGSSDDGSTDDGSTDGGSTDDGSTDGSDPTGGALLSEGFESLALGTQVRSWIDTGANNSLAEDDSLFSVVGFDGGRVLSTGSSETGIHSHYVATGSNAWTGYEVSGRMRGSASSSRLGVTALSRYPDSDNYYRLGTHWQTAELELFRHPLPDSSFQCSNAGTGTVLLEDRWYRFRFQVEPTFDATYLRAKAWAEGQSEPAVWTAECVDTRSGRVASGTIGVWSGSGGVKYWDDLQVISLGEGGSAPDPDPAPSEPDPLGAPGQPFIP